MERWRNPRWKAKRLTTSCLLVLTYCLMGYAADSLQIADSTVINSDIPLWSDTTLAPSDSLPDNTSFMERWITPFGFLLFSGAIAVGLFAIRSK